MCLKGYHRLLRKTARRIEVFFGTDVPDSIADGNNSAYY